MTVRRTIKPDISISYSISLCWLLTFILYVCLISSEYIKYPWKWMKFRCKNCLNISITIRWLHNSVRPSAAYTLQWLHNGRNSPPLFTQPEPFIQTQIKENIKAPRHWPMCGNSLVTSEFPAQMASYAENVSIWWRHHDASGMMHQESKPSQVQIMACHKFVAKPLSEPMLAYC